VVLSHAPTVWHESAPMHVTGVPTQEPFWQVGFVTHGPPLHVMPFCAFGFVAGHIPVAGLHVPVTWHWSVGGGGGHAMGLPLLHAPAWQVEFG
jgi:hypothetical protein